MAWQQSDLDALDAAMVSGIRSITFADGRKKEFQTLADMRDLRKDMKAELAGASAGSSRRNRIIVGRTRCR